MYSEMKCGTFRKSSKPLKNKKHVIKWVKVHALNEKFKEPVSIYGLM